MKKVLLVTFSDNADHQDTLFGMYEELRKAFIKRLTVDSPHHDARRKDFNQAIFDADEGFACFNGTDLDMVLEKFDAAVRDLTTYQKR